MSSGSEQGTLHLLTGHCDLAVPAAVRPHLRPGDTLVLMQDAVWLALRAVGEPLATLPQGVRILALHSDLQGRGLDSHALNPTVELASDADWVEASELHWRSITWSGG